MRQIDIDPGEVEAVREGNALWPGLIAFSGVTFLVYLGVEAATGAIPLDTALLAQLGAAAALAAGGIWLLARARYFYVVLKTATGETRISGLSKPEQQEIAARYRGES